VNKYEVEIWATSCRFKAGHRIRIDLACYDSNALDFGGHFLSLRVGKDTIYHERDHGSYLMLPVIPAR
jgi:predicted acyl esterase